MDARRRPTFGGSGGGNKPPIPNIWQLQSRNDVEGLVAALSHAEAAVRRGAAGALRALGAWHAVPALQAALTLELDWQAYAALNAAIQYLDRDVHLEVMIKNRDVKGLIKMLNSIKSDEVQLACEALASIGDKQGIEPLMIVFRNLTLHHKVRLAAAEALLKLNAAPATVTLLAALRRDDPRVRQNAAMILGQFEANWAQQPLIKALEDAHAGVRRAAAEALKKINSKEALEAIARYEDNEQRLANLGKADNPPPKPPDTGRLF